MPFAICPFTFNCFEQKFIRNQLEHFCCDRIRYVAYTAKVNKNISNGCENRIGRSHSKSVFHLESEWNILIVFVDEMLPASTSIFSKFIWLVSSGCFVEHYWVWFASPISTHSAAFFLQFVEHTRCFYIICNGCCVLSLNQMPCWWADLCIWNRERKIAFQIISSILNIWTNKPSSFQSNVVSGKHI